MTLWWLAGIGVGCLLGAWMWRRRLPTAPPADDLEGGGAKRIGPYKLIRSIARGGMGTVYEAEDRSGERYALKVPEPHVFADREFRERFRREIEIGKRLRHDHIVRIFDCSTDGETPYIALELVRGCNLKDLIDAEGALSVRRALTVTRDVLRAVGFGHQHGIIHRDIKPGNVLVAHSGIVKVADYGIARGIDMKTLTAMGLAIGTPAYMPPEAIETSHFSERGDLYSVGVLLYQMLTGQLPYGGEDPFKLLRGKRDALPAPPSAIVAAIPPEVDALVVKALQIDEARRWVTAAAFLAAVDRLLEELPAESL